MLISKPLTNHWQTVGSELQIQQQSKVNVEYISKPSTPLPGGVNHNTSLYLLQLSILVESIRKTHFVSLFQKSLLHRLTSKVYSSQVKILASLISCVRKS